MQTPSLTMQSSTHEYIKLYSDSQSVCLTQSLHSVYTIATFVGITLSVKQTTSREGGYADAEAVVLQS